MANKIEWPLDYDQLARVVNIWEELKANEEVLKPIVNKWAKKRRRKEVRFLCYSIIRSLRDQIERTYDVVTNFPNFDDRRVYL